MKAGDCPFCAIIAGSMPASRVWEDATAIAFMDLRQHVVRHDVDALAKAGDTCTASGLPNLLL